MKLNLLPTYVSKEKATRNAWVLAVVILLVCLVGAFFLYSKASSDLTASLDGMADAEGRAAKARDTAAYADTVMTNATGLLRNTELAKSMIKHNAAYPNLYDQVTRYIPSFYRINSLSATSAGPGVSVVQLNGVLDTYQQYADLMLALLRIPGVVSVERSGFVPTNQYVPALTPGDQIGRPHRPGEAPIPDDPLQRLEYLQGKAGVTGYEGQGGFGSGDPGTRGAMPGESEVAITIMMAYDLQTPDPAATLALGGGQTTATSGQTPPAGQNAPAPSRRGASGGSQEDE